MKQTILIHLLLLTCLLVFNSCRQSENEAVIPVSGHLDYTASQIEQMLRETFRIDIKTIEVVFDYFPEWGNSHVECRAKIVFTMRPGQTRAVIHLNPAVESKEVVNSIMLNNESLDLYDEADIRNLSFANTTQVALEFQRELAENREHTLEIAYRLTTHGKHPNWGWAISDEYPWFITFAIDIVGRGNEDVFPTINSPNELARHVLVFRVHSDTAYTFLGSGLVEQQPSAGVQEWRLDTEREISSQTVMFLLLPAEDIVYEERNIAGIDVRAMAFKDDLPLNDAFSKLEVWLPQLLDRLGSFPMPRGLSIFYISGGGGMEFYGGTTTNRAPLEHEVFHMYFGCSTVNKTYRDSWLDEAINMWYERSLDPYYQPIDEAFRSDMVSRFSPVALGFDGRAYDEGAQIMQAVAEKLGGRDQMIDFLSYLYRNHVFSPYTTMDFVDYLRDYSGIDMRQRFLNWLYSDGAEGTPDAAATSRIVQKHKIRMKPPESILKKYRKSTGSDR
jgi:hypothetical protein